ncbi:unnamed protein product [Paramecium primaurelia]|uniref:Uncharacterized protein n=1 Tax=Paramecium primaurelia TaxID=5886 RepID=A0A8S1L064_PARPR|nr:unnamed protein product [Paramecium primaurelia]
MNSNKDKIQRLINPSKLEYLEKVYQIFQEKLKEIDKSNFTQVQIWQYYYCYTQEFQNTEFQLSSILKRLDIYIKIYQEVQSKLQSDLIYEISLLKQFYESQFKEIVEQQLQIERIQNELKRGMEIDIQSEFIQIIQKKLYELEKGQIRKITEEFINYIWQYYQKKIQNECFELFQTNILKIIERYAEI